jgi:hypothetical protein
MHFKDHSNLPAALRLLVHTPHVLLRIIMVMVVVRA